MHKIAYRARPEHSQPHIDPLNPTESPEMSFIDRLDPELRESFHVIAAIFPEEWTPLSAAARRLVEPPPVIAAEGGDNGVIWSEEAIPAPDGRSIRVRVYRPIDASGPRPGALVIHGGGMWTGSLDSEHPACLELVAETGVIGVSVEYRLAPEHPYPAGLDDTIAAYRWMVESGENLGLDPNRIALVGGSAGGGLAVAAALRVRDSGGIQPLFLLAMYPMIDDRNERTSTHQDIPFPLWNRRGNLEGWEWYLGGHAADRYAAPAREGDVRGLPAAFFDVGTCDLFFDEVVDFAERVRAAGVPTELHVYPGLFHAAEFVAPDAAVSKQVRTTRFEAIRHALRIE